ncbi:MAG: PIG-L family deacetylase [Candidatus Gottesmanbacteria bacterium]|nr:PIG-L family deacetylase [Candidatus Gottesmanbacteria bacterium]
MKILVLVAHPDDEVIMCGAMMDKLVKHGHKVFVTYYTLNDQAYFKTETQSARRRRAMSEATKSSKYLGYSVKFLKFQDMRLQNDKGLLIQKTIKEIRRVQPDVIITHHAQDKHIDHRTLGEIIPEANFQSGCGLCGGMQTWKAPVVLQGEIDLEMTSGFNFHVVFEVSKQNIQRKIEAFLLYESVKSEHGTDEHWLRTKLLHVAEFRGRSVGAMYGEAFILNNYQPLDHKAIELLNSL